MDVAEMRMLRQMTGVTRRNKISTTLVKQSNQSRSFMQKNPGKQITVGRACRVKNEDYIRTKKENLKITDKRI